MDYFISHATEDKEDFVRDLATYMLINGATTFYDEYSINLGDSLFESINNGIRDSKNCILVISRYFLQKKWTMAELKAIINKHIDGELVLIPVYHNISYTDVKREYPLLADILGVISEVGYEKVAEKIFQATGHKPTTAYITAPKIALDKKKRIGFSISIVFGLTRRINPFVPKVIVEIGNRNVFRSRARLYVANNQRLYFELITDDYQIIAVSLDLTKWKASETHHIVGNVNTIAKTIALYCDGKLQSEMKYRFLKISPNFLLEKNIIIGMSLEHQFPTPFLIQNFSCGDYLTPDMIKSSFEIFNKFLKDLGLK